MSCDNIEVIRGLGICIDIILLSVLFFLRRFQNKKIISWLEKETHTFQYIKEHNSQSLHIRMIDTFEMHKWRSSCFLCSRYVRCEYLQSQEILHEQKLNLFVDLFAPVINQKVSFWHLPVFLLYRKS